MANKHKIQKKLSVLNLKEKLEDLYIYRELNGEFILMYNDEIKFPLNIKKMYIKEFGKNKKYPNNILDVTVKFDIERDLLEFTFYFAS